MSEAIILQGDCIEVLKTLEAGSVQCVVTSPPYYGLRDYGTARWEGGDLGCDHAEKRGGNGSASTKQVTSAGTQDYQYKDVCRKCGAIRVDNQIGLEETPEAYVEKMVQVFQEVRRVLADDGTLWLNLGDSYAGSGKGTGDTKTNNKQNGASRGVRIGSVHGESGHTSGVTPPPGYKAKDLLGIPWMIAFALRADGWYLRSDIIWHKPNPMPESVTDRPTKAHEYIFLLTKSAKYFYDAEAIQEPSVDQDRIKLPGSEPKSQNPNRTDNDMAERVREKYKNLQYNGQKPRTMHEKRLNGEEYTSLVRNKRSVWTVATKPYPEAHFATFPPDLIEPCILAGSRPGDTVLDPFNGSGTTGAVSIKHHRNYTGIDLNPDYIKLTNRRLAKVQPVLFAKL
jgi:DNA modification methylase